MASDLHLFLTQEQAKLNSKLHGCVIQDLKKHSFEVMLPDSLQDNTYGLVAISCAVPPGPDSFYETALISSDTSILYIEEFGYYDVCRLRTKEGVLQEIIDVIDKLKALMGK